MTALEEIYYCYGRLSYLYDCNNIKVKDLYFLMKTAKENALFKGCLMVLNLEDKVLKNEITQIQDATIWIEGYLFFHQHTLGLTREQTEPLLKILKAIILKNTDLIIPDFITKEMDRVQQYVKDLAEKNQGKEIDYDAEGDTGYMEEEDDYREERYGEINGFSQDLIDELFDGDASLAWNLD
jgi:hypothetical protein